MPQRSDTLDLGRLALSSGQGRRLDLHVHLEDFDLGGARYTVEPHLVPMVLDISRTTSSGYALRLRFDAELVGACMKCLEEASPSFTVDSREVDVPGGGDELSSPYVDAAGELDLAQWARDALALTLPTGIACSAECRGLCPECGVNLNHDPAHEHEKAPDPRWAKLGELKLD